MHILKRAALTLATLSVVAAPVAASAASGIRATSPLGEASELEGDSSWIIGLIGLLAGIAAIIVIADDDDAPASP